MALLLPGSKDQTTSSSCIWESFILNFSYVGSSPGNSAWANSLSCTNISKNLSAATSASSFADDTRAQRGISSPEDCSDLQADLQLVYNWAEKVNMKFNSGKFECIRYWADAAKAPTFEYLAPDMKPIEVKSDLRDLGVQLCNNLRFSVHIEDTVTAGSKIVGWGLRTLTSRSRAVMLTLMKSLVQPKLDYCYQLWSPADQTSINQSINQVGISTEAPSK